MATWNQRKHQWFTASTFPQGEWLQKDNRRSACRSCAKD